MAGSRTPFYGLARVTPGMTSFRFRCQRSEISKNKRRSTAVTYWLEDVDLDGRRTLHGPIAPLVQHGTVKAESARH